MIREATADTTPWAYVPPVSGISNTTTAVTIAAAAGAGLRNYITDIQIAHGTLGAATEFAIRDGAGGAVLLRLLLNTGSNENSRVGPLKTPIFGSANTLLEIVTLTAVTGNVYANVQGYSAV